MLALFFSGFTGFYNYIWFIVMENHPWAATEIKKPQGAANGEKSNFFSLFTIKARSRLCRDSV